MRLPVALLIFPLLLNCSSRNAPHLSREDPAQNPSETNPPAAESDKPGSIDPQEMQSMGEGKKPVCLTQNNPAPAPAVLNPAAPAAAYIRTSGAGRVRLRHEKEERFNKFGGFYWEHRSFGLTVDDYSSSGVKKLVFTFRPIGKHATDQEAGLDGLPNGGLPNIRIFDTGDGNVFHINDQMRDQPEANVFTYTFTDPGNNANLRLEKGRTVEFEFGIFLDRKKINSRTDGDTNYYTDTFRIEIGRPGLLVGLPGQVGKQEDPFALAAGAVSVAFPVVVTERNLAFSQNAMNAQAQNLQHFLEGRSFFHTDFTTGQHTEAGISFKQDRVARQQGRAGPVMETASCAGCHDHNGRLAANNQTAPEHVLKIAKADGTPHPEWGYQLQRSERAAAAQTLTQTPGTTQVALSDGTSVTLSFPRYELKSDGFLVSARIPQQIIGLGLLEAISPETILARASCEPDKPGITGKALMIKDPENGQWALGRFGWKAGKVSLKHQVGEALLFDLGVTNPLFPDPACEKTADCPVSKNETEVDADALNRLTSYMQLIAVPVQRNRTDPAFQRGEKVFQNLGCASCHVPEQKTGDKHPLVELRQQRIFPYTDLLLHDMGPGLADGKPEGKASGSEWRTPPLWGLGLLETVNGKMSLLHDGRANSFEQAILWHGGEAQSHQEAYRRLPLADRNDLAFFLKSL